MKKIIHVNRQFIAFNAKVKSPVLPTYIVREKNKVTYAYGVNVIGTMIFVDPRTNQPLKCGARAWMETNDQIVLINPMSYQEALKLKKNYEHEKA